MPLFRTDPRLSPSMRVLGGRRSADRGFLLRLAGTVAFLAAFGAGFRR